MLPPENLEFLCAPGGRFSVRERLGREGRMEKLWNVLLGAGRVYVAELIGYPGT